ncbi:IS30 family transposase, partial [Vagococcus silagei]
MTYTHLTTDELVLIESYYHQTKKVKFDADALNRSKQTIYNVYNALDNGLSIFDYYKRYKSNKKKCGRRP